MGAGKCLATKSLRVGGNEPRAVYRDVGPVVKADYPAELHPTEHHHGNVFRPQGVHIGGRRGGGERGCVIAR